MEFVDGLRGAGPEFAQAKVIDYLNSLTAYTADGLVAPINWSTGHTDPQTHPEIRAASTCQPMLLIKNGQFTVYKAPADKPWICLDIDKPATQTPQFKSFSPTGSG